MKHMRYLFSARMFRRPRGVSISTDGTILKPNIHLLRGTCVDMVSRIVRCFVPINLADASVGIQPFEVIE